MSELLITENAFAPLTDAVSVPDVLELEGCDLERHGPPRDLAGLAELSIAGGRVTAAALQRWLAACPDLNLLDVDGAELGDLSWKILPPRLQQLFLRGGKLARMVDPPAVSGLQVIELTSCGLEALELPASAASLESISLAYNRTLGACPDLPWSAAAFALDLRGCGLSSWPTASGAEKVSELDLSFNAIGVVPKEVEAWSILGTLRLQDCELTQLDAAIGSLSLLRELWLTDNVLVQFPEGLYELPDLRTLDLSRCRLSEFPERIGEMRSLEVLLLSENSLRQVPVAILELENLLSLHLLKTELSSLPSSLAGLNKLRQLELSYNPLEQLPELSGLPALGFLGLCGLRNLDWQQGFDCLAQLQRVGIVSFTNNDFETFDSRVFEIADLHRIDVNKTGVDDAEWQRYREAFPDVTIWGG